MTTAKGKGKERDQGNDHSRWGFVLPETTMMKSHRASWRSAREFVTVHDASYYSVFRVGARIASNDALSDEKIESDLLRQLQKCLVEAGIARTMDLETSDPNKSPQVLDTVLVEKKANPQRSSSRDVASSSSAVLPVAALAPVRIVLLSGTRRFEQLLGQEETHKFDCKEAMIFVHPAGDLHVRRALKAAGITMIDENKNAVFKLEAPSDQLIQTYASQLDSAPDSWLAAGGKDSSISKLERKRRRQAYSSGTSKVNSGSWMDTSEDEASTTVLLDDKAELMRLQGYNMFELIGPRAAPLLQSVLKEPQGSESTNQSKLRQLLATPRGSAPSMVDVLVNDPRLSYPPKLKPLTTNENDATSVSKSPHLLLQAEDLRKDGLFWCGSSPPRFSKGEIDSRRALSAKPGARLQPDSRDDIVPAVVIRDRLVQKPQMDRFTLIVPRGWGLAFFLSLVATHKSGASCGARVLGQHQLKHQRLELAALSSSGSTQKDESKAAMLSYPHNWLGTQAYAVDEKQAAVARQEEWAKRPRGKRTEYLFVSHQDWRAFLQNRTEEEVAAKLSNDRVGVSRPYPFGGSHHWEWIVGNSERLYGKTIVHAAQTANAIRPWLVALPDFSATAISTIESALSASHLASAMVAVKLQAARKGTVMPLSSLMLPNSFEDHLAWMHHLDSTDHPALVANRTASGAAKMDKQHLKALVDRRFEIMQLGRSAPSSAAGVKRQQSVPAGDVWSGYSAEAFDPEQMHDRSADWNNAIGTVLDGDYSLGNGKGFGIGAVTLRAWCDLLQRQQRLDAMRGDEEKGRRRARNPINTTNLLLMREPGTDVVRAVTATLIPLV